MSEELMNGNQDLNVGAKNALVGHDYSIDGAPQKCLNSLQMLKRSQTEIK